MRKRIVGMVLVLLQLILCLTPFVSASGAGDEQICVLVDSYGIQNEETVIRTSDGTIMVPCTWLTKYGMMACSEEENRYVFSNPGESQNLRFAKRIYVERSGESAVYGYYVSGVYAEELQFVEMISVEFTDARTEEGVLYLPLVEYLPLFNASIEITNDGVLHINANTMSVFSALYGLQWDEVEFEADNVIGNWFVAGSGLIADTIFDWRFDRLDFLGNSGQIEDYRKLYKAYLTDDATFLASFDQEETPADKYVEMTSDILNTSSDVIGRTNALPKFLAYLLESDEYPLTSEISEGFSDFSGIMGTGKDILKGGYKLVSYYHTYSNQVEDHYKMLEAVYGSGQFHDSDPACAAAQQTLDLYGEMGEKTQKAVMREMAEYLAEEVIADLLTDNAIVKPYKIALAVVKATCPEMVEEASDAALLYFMDAVVDDAQDVFEFGARGIKLNEDSLEELRLSAMLALIASRNAYDAYDIESKTAAINARLEKLYLAADSAEYESCEHYEKLKGKLAEDASMLRPADSIRSQYPSVEELFDGTCWSMIYGQTLGSLRTGLFQTDGTILIYEHGPGTYIDGSYEYDQTTGTLIVTFNPSGIADRSDEFEYGGTSFSSVLEYEMQVGKEHLIISPSSDGMRYFEENPEETEPPETEPSTPRSGYSVEMLLEGGMYTLLAACDDFQGWRGYDDYGTGHLDGEEFTVAFDPRTGVIERITIWKMGGSLEITDGVYSDMSYEELKNAWGNTYDWSDIQYDFPYGGGNPETDIHDAYVEFAWGESGNGGSDWSGWSWDRQSIDANQEEEVRTVWGYYYYLCEECGAHWHGYDIPCFEWGDGCGAASISRDFHKVWSTVSWEDANLQDWHGTGKYYTYIDGELVFKWTEHGSARQQYRYRTVGSSTPAYQVTLSFCTPIAETNNIPVVRMITIERLENGHSGDKLPTAGYGGSYYALIENPFLDGNYAYIYLWSERMDMDTWVKNVEHGQICNIRAQWEDLHDTFTGDMLLGNWGYEEDGRLWIQGTSLEGNMDMEYLLSEDGTVSLILSGDGYTYVHLGTWTGLQYAVMGALELAQDCVYSDARSGQSERITRQKMLEYFAENADRSYLSINAEIASRENGIYITELEIPYFP